MASSYLQGLSRKKYQSKYGMIVAYIFNKKGVIKHGVER
ncbi:hypothetical protein BN165_1170024 [Clostridioides difficile E1]|nr:hypothetical protein BN164_1150024 [Clostridioides difficile T20]CCK94738.1 hypothetical protein BN165_1170024 [Clostridioides difficile E1]